MIYYFLNYKRLKTMDIETKELFEKIEAQYIVMAKRENNIQ